jgi:hypothetical protein
VGCIFQGADLGFGVPRQLHLLDLQETHFCYWNVKIFLPFLMLICGIMFFNAICGLVSFRMLLSDNVNRDWLKGICFYQILIGISNASGIFQHMANNILRHISQEYMKEMCT